MKRICRHSNEAWSMDERKWIRQILVGDMQMFSCLVAKYERMAFSIAFRLMGNREEAEEVVQDAFVKMYHSLPDFRFDSLFSTWFYRIVYRTALSALRRRPETVDYEEIDTVNLMDEEVESATSLLERTDRKTIIAEVLHHMPPDEALLLTLYYLEECSVEEIQQIMDLSPSNVKVKLYRARKRFYVIVNEKMNMRKADLL